MATKIKQGVRAGIRYIVMAFLIVSLTQVLVYFHILGESFPEKILITFVSLILASVLIAIATHESQKRVILK